MTRAPVCCLAALLLFGCKSGEDPVRGANPGVPAVSYASAAEPEAATVDVPPRPEPQVDTPDLDGEAKEEQPRDLGEELKAALGVPIDCIQDFTAARPTKIRVSVAATVRPTGMVITPTAYGTGLSAAARQCIERRVSTVALQPLEEPVSERVSTVIEIDYTPEVVVESEPGVPEPRLRNVQEPLPKRPDIPPSGRPIQQPTSVWVSQGFDGGRPIQEPTSKKVKGPKPRPIDGYDVDENAQDWTD